MMDLKKVLLPAPLGPIRQRSSRSRKVNATLLTASTPPKRTLRSWVSTTVSVMSRRPGPRRHGDGASREPAGGELEIARDDGASGRRSAQIRAEREAPRGPGSHP